MKYQLLALCFFFLFSGSLTAAETRNDSRIKNGILTSQKEVANLPMDGPAWENILDAASESTSSPDLSDQNDKTNMYVLAKALVYSRTGDEDMRQDVAEAIMDAIGTHKGGRTLALGRELGAYVVAADLIGLDSKDDQNFRSYIASVIKEPMGGRAGIDTLTEAALTDPSNWGCHARGTVAAVAVYLNNEALLEEVTKRFHDWTGRTGNNFVFKDKSWQCNEKDPVGINPKGCFKEGVDLDGVLPDDQRRAGTFDPDDSIPKENYVWECAQGTMAAAIYLHRAGYTDVFNWEDQALLRSANWLHDVVDFPASGDDQWVPHIFNYYYGTDFPAADGANFGKNLGFTDWLYGLGSNNPIVEAPAAEEPVAEEPVAEEPVAEEPVAEEPVAEEPVAEEPVAEEPVNDSPASSLPGESVVHMETQSGASTDDAEVKTFGQLTGASDDLYLAAISTRKNMSASVVTGLGLTWTRIEIQCSGRNATGIDVWMAQGTPSGNGKVTATFSNAPANAVLVVSRYSNVDPIDPIGQVASGNSNGITGHCADGTDSSRYAFDLTAVTDGSIVYGAASIRNKKHQPGPGFTERAEVHQGSGGEVTSVVVEDKIGTSGSTISINGTLSRRTDWAIIGLEIKSQP